MFISIFVRKKFPSFKFSRKIRLSILIISSRDAARARSLSWQLPYCPHRVSPCIVLCIAVYDRVSSCVLRCISVYYRVLSQPCLDVYRDGKSPFPHQARVISFFNRLSFLLVSIGIVSYQMAEANISDPFHIQMLCSSALRFFLVLGFWATDFDNCLLEPRCQCIIYSHSP